MWRRRLQGHRQFLAVSTEEKDLAPNAGGEGGEFWRTSPSWWDLIAAEGGVPRAPQAGRGTTGNYWGVLAPMCPWVCGSSAAGQDPGPWWEPRTSHLPPASLYSRMSLMEDSGRDKEDLPPQVHHHFEDTPQYPSGLSDPSRISWSYRTTPGPWLCPHLSSRCLLGCHLFVPHPASPRISCFGAVSLAAIPSGTGTGPHG